VGSVLRGYSLSPNLIEEHFFVFLYFFLDEKVAKNQDFTEIG
jgi:hypothetical protein